MFSQSQNWWRTNGNTPQITDYLGTSNNSPLIIKTNSTERVRIAPNGFVGIGIANPQHVLDVNGRAKLRYNVYCDSLLQASQLVVNYSIQTSTVDAHVYLINGQPAVFSQWTSIPPNAIAFNGDVYVNTLNAQSGISIGNFKFRNGAIPPQRDTIKSDRMVSFVADKSIEFRADTVRFTDKVGIGKVPVAALDVNGDAVVSGKIRVNRITSGDSLIKVGDSSIVINTSFNRIYATPSNGRMGLAISGGSSSDGFGLASIAMGTHVQSYGMSSIGIGKYVKTNVPNSIVIGIGYGTNYLENNIPNSVMIGAQSMVPSIFVAPSTNPNISGKVGIGTTNPTSQLEVIGEGKFGHSGGSVSMGFNTAHAYLTGSDLTASDGKEFLINYYDPATDIVLASNNTRVSGKLGIGTNSPQKQLHINNGNGDAEALVFSASNKAAVWTANGTFGYGFGVDASGKGHIWKDLNTPSDVMVFDGSGNVGIGTTNPTSQLEVIGEGKFGHSGGSVSMGFNTAHAYLTGSDPTASDGKAFLINYYDPATDIVLASNNTIVSGKLGIGTSDFSCQDPNVRLAVNGTIKSKEWIVEITNWCDDVFNAGYQKMNWKEKRNYHLKYGHLPYIKSEQEILKEGLRSDDLKGMMRNIEEDRLDIEELYERLEIAEQKITEQNKLIQELIKYIWTFKQK
ncbi:MAG: hypothetical protein Fur0023_21840 [Bacteroidia bacterium]